MLLDQAVQLRLGGGAEGCHLAGDGIGELLDVHPSRHSALPLSSFPGHSPSRMVSAALTALPRAVWKSAPFCAIQPAMYAGENAALDSRSIPSLRQVMQATASASVSICPRDGRMRGSQRLRGVLGIFGSGAV